MLEDLPEEERHALRYLASLLTRRAPQQSREDILSSFQFQAEVANLISQEDRAAFLGNLITYAEAIDGFGKRTAQEVAGAVQTQKALDRQQQVYQWQQKTIELYSGTPADWPALAARIEKAVCLNPEDREPILRDPPRIWKRRPSDRQIWDVLWGSHGTRSPPAWLKSTEQKADGKLGLRPLSA